MAGVYVVVGLTADPFTVAHRELIEAALPYGQWVEVVLPGDHPWKPGITPFSHRLAMAVLGTEGIPHCRVNCEIPLQLGAESYTYREIQLLQAQYPHHRIRYLIGSDVVPVFHRYREAEWLVSQIELLVAPRDDDDVAALIAASPLLSRLSTPPIILPPLRHNHISSTAVRTARTQGWSWEEWVPSAVANYIRIHDLYVPADGGEGVADYSNG